MSNVLTPEDEKIIQKRLRNQTTSKELFTEDELKEFIEWRGKQSWNQN